MEGLRPLDLGELLDTALRVYRHKGRTLVASVAIPVIPATILSALVLWSSAPSAGGTSQVGVTSFTGSHSRSEYAGLLVYLALRTVATSLAVGACYRSISAVYIGDDVGWKESLAFGVRRLPKIVAVAIIVAVISYGGLFFCLVPGVWAWAALAVAVPVLLVEDAGVFASIKRSAALVRGSWWRTFGILLAAYVLALAFQVAVSLPLTAMLTNVHSKFMSDVATVTVQTILAVMIQPFTACATMAVYIDLRVRKEGFDIVLWAQRLGVTVEQGGFPVRPTASFTPATDWSPRPPPDLRPPPPRLPPPPTSSGMWS